VSGTTATAIVRRFDAAQLGQAKRTPQGFLRASARLTRTGVLTYKRADGTVCRELRRPEQVFHPDSLATLGDAPLTDLHPKEMVSPENVSALSVGHVSHASARADGQYVEADVVVTDAKMIAAVEAGKRKEVSCGYKCKLLAGAGVWNGEHYDAEQIDIVYNHAGLGPPKWGRAGSEVSLRLDGGGDDFVLDAADAWLDADDAEKEKTMELVTLRVDGIDCQVTKEASQVITKGLAERDAAIAQAAKDSAASKARLDTVQGELDGTKVKLTEAADPKRFDSAVTARIGLLEHARKVLGAETKLDGLTTRAIHELVVLKVQPKAELTGKSDEYVAARFDSIEPPTVTNLEDVRRVLKPIVRTDENGERTAPAAVPAWQKPLTAHRKD
jgi:hypothetical protein